MIKPLKDGDEVSRETVNKLVAGGYLEVDSYDADTDLISYKLSDKGRVAASQLKELTSN